MNTFQYKKLFVAKLAFHKKKKQSPKQKQNSKTIGAGLSAGI